VAVHQGDIMSAMKHLRSAPGVTDSLSETVASLEAQLASFYEEQVLAGGRSHGQLMQTVEGLEVQLKDLYDEREHAGHAPGAAADAEVAVRSLEAQVRALLDEKNEHEGAAEAGAIAVSSLDAQVRALLDEKVELEGAVSSLEEQVRALLDEKRDLEVQLEATRERARKATHSLIEQFVVGP
jgi:chromosome segregation ATPase